MASSVSISTKIFRLLLLSFGKGWYASIPSGVNVGKIVSLKSLSNLLKIESDKFSGLHITIS